jgi:hypothetical protein
MLCSRPDDAYDAAMMLALTTRTDTGDRHRRHRSETIEAGDTDPNL